MIYTDRNDATIDAICRAVGYTGRKIKLNVTDKVRMLGTYWDGGSRSTYHGINLATMASVDLPHFNPPQFGGPSSPPEIELKDNLAIVEWSVFCGKDTGLTINIQASNAAPLLPKPVELTDDELIVLSYTARLKSSYGGVSNYRFVQASRDGKITLDRWNASKVILGNRGLLDKRGAITNEGRNALNSHPNSRKYR